jgi:hypothetical protein
MTNDIAAGSEPELPIKDMLHALSSMPEDLTPAEECVFLISQGWSVAQAEARMKERAQHVGPERDQFGNKIPQSTALVNMASEWHLFHTPGGKAYATIQVEGRIETYAIKSADFKSHLYRLYYVETKKALGSTSLQDAIGLLEARAQHDGPEEEVHCRVASCDGSIYLDLANKNREVVTITPQGWKVVNDCPVKFRRPKAMLGADSDDVDQSFRSDGDQRGAKRREAFSV